MARNALGQYTRGGTTPKPRYRRPTKPYTPKPITWSVVLIDGIPVVYPRHHDRAVATVEAVTAAEARRKYQAEVAA